MIPIDCHAFNVTAKYFKAFNFTTIISSIGRIRMYKGDNETFASVNESFKRRYYEYVCCNLKNREKENPTTHNSKAREKEINGL